ncbi:UDP-N-acetylmuramate--L-alanine ligase [Rhodanobacter glycinis]|uniref:UDP-N-acetylmuramate--L-alanine ligase n=1 Tax=Rhodanobacter glycinis TaxID=582702 RepID=A0A502FD53_9GAMM|nr:UDP-N-acetylmuramate--L-alanine ligase [Rhodanobacter glycinis]TPG11810.1 UDP-N-acetylmuramate--L-alanine ligase [Rhodanobacter glycinis]TPG47335.1 UDP-N-acetylmuramate--L-alanine ligase [Rhodanobacter glycinis]
MTPRRLHAHEDLMSTFKRVHFIGIGGVGMSGIAEVLHNLGYAVSGSDRANSPTAQRLQQLGITVHVGHAAGHIGDADVVVTSSAIKPDNAELVAARAARIPVIPRAEMLGELMRFRRGVAIAGTHGKTTTTSLTASVLAEAGYDPTFVIGGQLNAAGANARLGTGQYLVAEADESDGSFLLLSPVIAAVTNIDADHLENYGGDFAQVKQAFDDFLHRLPFYGLAVLCVDDAEVAELAKSTTRRVMTYGIDTADADVRALNVTQHGFEMHFDLVLPGRAETLPVKLNLPGRHNVLNALAAATIGWQLGVEAEAMAHALEHFQGVGRRFHRRGEIALDHGSVLLVDDYGHHPRELAAVFAAARGGWPDRRLVVGFQPHRYSRTRDLLDDFANVLADADVLVLTDVYAAGETPIAGADGRALARAVRARGKVDPVLIEHPREFKDTLPALLRDGDLLLLLGAGDIGAAAVELAQVGHLRTSK